MLKLMPVIKPWSNIVKEVLLAAYKTIDKLLAQESKACFEHGGTVCIVNFDSTDAKDELAAHTDDHDAGWEEWMEIMQVTVYDSTTPSVSSGS
ncbi:hypothetical protein H0H81_000757 [Sphagnurus paluster]|uniref:Uncharacterized protein n=1 Tax=Sphagnurus paluster TaxID=117069 RepID=A0A9P7FSZ2_9AGAR|nr:hypothetical protein H0H81_000757 [Sphagnurus paluster]